MEGCFDHGLCIPAQRRSNQGTGSLDSMLRSCWMYVCIYQRSQSLCRQALLSPNGNFCRPPLLPLSTKLRSPCNRRSYPRPLFFNRVSQRLLTREKRKDPPPFFPENHEEAIRGGVKSKDCSPQQKTDYYCRTSLCVETPM